MDWLIGPSTPHLDAWRDIKFATVDRAVKICEERGKPASKDNVYGKLNEFERGLGPKGVVHPGNIPGLTLSVDHFSALTSIGIPAGLKSLPQVSGAAYLWPYQTFMVQALTNFFCPENPPPPPPAPAADPSTAPTGTPTASYGAGYQRTLTNIAIASGVVGVLAGLGALILTIGAAPVMAAGAAAAGVFLAVQESN